MRSYPPLLYYSLTYVHSEEAEEPLTPSHLLLGHRLLSTSAPTSSSESLETEEVSRHANYLKILLRHFWKRWRLECLSELREHHPYLSEKSTAVPPSVQNEDVVIIKEDNVARNLWILARVEELIVSEDCHVRGAVVPVATELTSLLCYYEGQFNVSIHLKCHK